jgi:hypothetical protein
MKYKPDVSGLTGSHATQLLCCSFKPSLMARPRSRFAFWSFLCCISLVYPVEASANPPPNGTATNASISLYTQPCSTYNCCNSDPNTLSITPDIYVNITATTGWTIRHLPQRHRRPPRHLQNRLLRRLPLRSSLQQHRPPSPSAHQPMPK